VRRAALLFLLGACALACGALGASTSNDAPLPSAGIGPFRPLTTAEELATAPFVLDGNTIPYGEPSALAVTPTDPTSLRVFLYLVGPPPTGGTATAILRTRADDARSFFGTTTDEGTKPVVVLSATLPWEGASLTGPSALRVEGSVYLYYAAAGGIGLARGTASGLTFDKEAAPVLAVDPSVRWETTAPFAPSVAQLPDGSFDMMYAAGLSIGEAVSADGLHFTRVDADLSTPTFDPVLAPLGTPAGFSADAGADAAASLPFDTTQVSDPCVLPATTPAGRLVVRVLYTGFDGAAGTKTQSSAIGLAARYGTTGPLVRQSVPAFSISKHEAAPTLFAWSAGTLLYVQANAGANVFSPGYAAIAAGVAPIDFTFAKPEAGVYATTP